MTKVPLWVVIATPSIALLALAVALAVAYGNRRARRVKLEIRAQVAKIEGGSANIRNRGSALVVSVKNKRFVEARLRGLEILRGRSLTEWLTRVDRRVTGAITESTFYDRGRPGELERVPGQDQVRWVLRRFSLENRLPDDGRRYRLNLYYGPGLDARTRRVPRLTGSDADEMGND